MCIHFRHVLHYMGIVSECLGHCIQASLPEHRVIESKPDNVLEDLRYAQRPKASVYTALNDLMRAGGIVCCMTAPAHRSPILKGCECLYPFMFSVINVFIKY